MGDSEPRSEFSSGPSAARSSAALPDEGAELRDQIVQIREAPNLRILSALLVRLLALLERRFAWEEGEAGDLRALDREAADRMSGEHRDILAAIRDLIGRAQADTSRQLPALLRGASAILAALASCARFCAARSRCARRLSYLPGTPKCVSGFPPTRSIGPSGMPGEGGMAEEKAPERRSLHVPLPASAGWEGDESFETTQLGYCLVTGGAASWGATSPMS